MCVRACVRNTFLKTGIISVAPAEILAKIDTLVPWTPVTLFSLFLPPPHPWCVPQFGHLKGFKVG